MFLVLNMVCSRFLSLKENALSIVRKVDILLNKIESNVLSFREKFLYIVSKNAIIRLLVAGSFLIAYLHLLKNFFLLPYIIPDYNLIVNVDIKIYIDILIISLYSLTTEKLYETHIDMLIDLLVAAALTLLGMYLPI